MVTSLNTEPDEPVVLEVPEAPPIEGAYDSPPLGDEPVVGTQDAPPVPIEASQPPPQEQPSPVAPPTPPTQDMRAELEELHKMRQVNAQKEWEQQVYRQAQAVERRAQEQGSDPQSARQIARQHVASQKQLRDQQNKDFDLIRNIEGRQAATLHMLQKYGLANKQMIEDYQSLTGFTNPQDMEREAKRMSQIRQQAAEIARLKQGQVAPQTFDNSQGAAEATSNQSRLLQEYIAGYNTEAHQAASRRAAGMGS